MNTLSDGGQRLADARIGTTLQGKWRLDRLLGTGGMAVVYAATHRNGRQVAIKVLTSKEPILRERFLREGLAANAVAHPGAVQVHDEDIAEDGSAFLVMELLEGDPLDVLLELRGGRLPPLTVLGLADQLLDVLGAAHARGIVHRDIKPQNLFLTRSGTLKVLDFGVARLRQRFSEDETADTQTGVILGTVAYMAPEQASAQREQIDGRTDIWSVGATMFRMLTGRVVHEAENDIMRLVAAISRPAPSLATLMPELAQPIVDVVDRALAFKPADRWPDARTMRCAVRLAQGWLLHASEAGAHARWNPTSDAPLLVETLTSTRISRHSLHSIPGADKTVESVAISQARGVPSGARHALPSVLWALAGVTTALAAGLLIGVRTASDRPAVAQRGLRGSLPSMIVIQSRDSSPDITRPDHTTDAESTGAPPAASRPLVAPSPAPSRRPTQAPGNPSRPRRIRRQLFD